MRRGRAAEYTAIVEPAEGGWRIVGEPDPVYRTLQEAWDEARQDLLYVGGGRIEVRDRRGRVRACASVTVRDLGHTG